MLDGLLSGWYCMSGWNADNRKAAWLSVCLGVREGAIVMKRKSSSMEMGVGRDLFGVGMWAMRGTIGRWRTSLELENKLALTVEGLGQSVRLAGEAGKARFPLWRSISVLPLRYQGGSSIPGPFQGSPLLPVLTPPHRRSCDLPDCWVLENSTGHVPLAPSWLSLDPFPPWPLLCEILSKTGSPAC